MSYMKREWEEENADNDPFTRCAICGEFTDECICGDVATEGHHVESEAETDNEGFFAPWAQEMVRAEVSRGMLDQMWSRVKIRLDDLGKVEQLIADVFGHRARMVP